MAEQEDVVVVTGGSAGIGQGIVDHFLDAGASVINLDVKEGEREASPRYRFHKVDLCDADATREVASELAANYSVSHLVNNAGNPLPGFLEEVSDEDFHRGVQLQLHAPIILAQAFTPVMVKNGFGRIINITSRAALGKKARSIYSATKSGLAALTRTWALELGEKGITVNAISPGPVMTELFKKNNPPEIAQQLVASTVVGRAGEPADIARAVLFLADRRNGYITGQVLHVCGGSSLGSAAR